MGTKLLWSGATLLLVDNLLIVIPASNVVGAVLMFIGLILLWLDK